MPRFAALLLLAATFALAAEKDKTPTVAVKPSVLVGDRIDAHLVARLVSLSPDGNSFTWASGSRSEHVLRVADRRSKAVLFQVPAYGALDCAFTADGRRLVVVRCNVDQYRDIDAPPSAEVYDVLTGRRMHSIALDADNLRAGEVVGPWRVLVCGDLLVVRNARKGDPKLFEVSDRLYRSAQAGSFADVYDLRTGNALGVLKGEHVPAFAALSADGRTLATLDGYGAVRLFDTVARKHLRDFPATADRVSAFALSGDGRRLAVGCLGGPVYVYDAAAGKRVGNYARLDPEHLGFLGDGSTLLVGSKPARRADDDDPWLSRLVDLGSKADPARVVPAGRSGEYRGRYHRLPDFGPLLPRLASRDGRIVLAASERAGIIAVEFPAKP